MIQSWRHWVVWAIDLAAAPFALAVFHAMRIHMRCVAQDATCTRIPSEMVRNNLWL